MISNTVGEIIPQEVGGPAIAKPDSGRGEAPEHMKVNSWPVCKEDTVLGGRVPRIGAL